MHSARARLLITAATLACAGCAADPILGNASTAPPHTRNAFDKISEPFVGSPRYTCRRSDEENCVPPAVLPGDDPNHGYFSPKRLNELFGREKTAGRNDGAEVPYSLGLALAGGGTKASDYSMGVLAALHDPSNHDLSERVDIISSVSGGSYASLWYYSRLIDHYQIARQSPADREPFDSVFFDCLPLRYKSLSYDSRDPKLCPDYDSAYAGPPAKDDHAYQNHLRGFQDLFSKNFDYDSTNVDSNSAVVAALQQGGLTALTLPLHWFALGLFDWKPLNLGLSARQYFDGIERTWGLRPVNCKRLSNYKGEGDWKTVCQAFTDGLRPAPNRNAGRGYTMTSLAALYYHEDEFNSDMLGTDAPNIPFWVLNTTAGVSKVAFSFEARQAPDFEDAVFEFTPYAYGSRHFGYWVGTPSGYELHRLAGASAAFLDGQQRTLDKRILNAVAAGLLNVANLNWGVNLDNPRFRDEVRTAHLFLPFPLSAFHHRRVNNDGAWIHLSDGGQSDNTGVWSLVRRGVRTIVLADHAYDEGGDLADICHLRRNLRRHKLYLRLPELAHFNDVCARGSRGPYYDLWAWSPRVVRGCITTSRADINCGDPHAVYFAKLLVLKPALDMNQLKGFIACAPGTCAAELARLRAVPGYEDFPTELFGFLVNNRKVLHENGHLRFPQHSTVSMTLNSSPWLYGAYRELARWQAAGLAREIDRPVAPLVAVVPVVEGR